MKRMLCLLLLCHSSVQLRCDKTQIQANLGSRFDLVCNYQTSRFLYSKKYWCLGESRATCVVLVDTEGLANTEQRARIIDRQQRGLLISMTGLKLEDTGIYWVGIDKVYADIMITVHLTVTEVAVSKPLVWPLSSMKDSCWGQPVTMRCGSVSGTNVHYSWYQHARPRDIQIQTSSDLQLHCGIVEEDRQYYCGARNTVSNQHSGIVSLNALQLEEEDCIYSIDIESQRGYDCSDRLKTSTAPLLSTCHVTEQPYHTGSRNESTFSSNQTEQDWLHIRAWTGLPLWYEVLRWLFLASLLATVCIVHKFTQVCDQNVPINDNTNFLMQTDPLCSRI